MSKLSPMFKDNPTLAILGLGYVGLPLALAFGAHFKTIGYDISYKRICELQSHHDYNQEIAPIDFTKAPFLHFTNNLYDLEGVDVFIIAMPTPIDANNQPDLSKLQSASILVGSLLRPFGLVIYESTTYPTCTQKFCAPLLEQASKLVYNQDFFIGYSPERINVGEKRPFNTIVKLTSGSTPESARYVDWLYSHIAPTYLTSSIEIAESAKILENTQRDLNIAFVNDMAMLLARLNIPLYEVLDACKTKWNFLPFSPGFVGGHCIGIDSYYLAFLAKQLDYDPVLIQTTRQINNAMPSFIASKITQLLNTHKLPIQGASILLLGVSFKENCNDLRNTQSLLLKQELESFGCCVALFDPLIDSKALEELYQTSLLEQLPQTPTYHAIILVIGHGVFRNIKIPSILLPQGFIYDLKRFFNPPPPVILYTP
ncbi:nucleotide sugar dehydrogenase [Helicobacter suis]|uniref:nucleotide sugar dehydrogenase n=1 Tax=Helicobacter suis TaxID=104628 RepID=UPI001F0868D6|nr:nucleotide sugar dehydrogenase [Helicobacter suis]